MARWECTESDRPVPAKDTTGSLDAAAIDLRSGNRNVLNQFKIGWIPHKRRLDMATDPICDMTVDEASALNAERDGQIFYYGDSGHG